MGSITTGVGLISGINTAQLIEGLLALESRPKILMQQRVATLQTQRTALLDINARLLNLRTAAKSFRIDKIFKSALATSSNEDILTATAGTSAQPGIYQFIVKQLVTSSQKLSMGFADKSTTPLGLDQLSFEFGHGGLSVDKSLSDLNGGAGVDRGRIVITDKSGTEATVDLTDVTSLDEVIQRINDAAVGVTASVDGDRLVISDTTGGAGTLTVANATGDTTATDLGIAGSAAGVATSITGTAINVLGGSTSLGSLNDGTGVLIKDGVTDIAMTARDGTLINVKLGRVDSPITAATLLSDLNNGLGVKIGDEDNSDMKFVARDGTEHEVSLNGVTTIGGLISRVNSATGGKIQISVHTDGERLVVTDTTGGAGNLQVLGAGDNGTDTAEDLGILNAAGVAAASFNGAPIPNTISDPPAATIADVIDRINNASGNAGKIVASIAADGVSLLITDTTGGAGNLIVQSSAANPHAASQLGIDTGAAGVAAATVDGTRLIAGLGSVLTRHLNGGSGLGAGTSLTLTDRSGASFTVNNLDTLDSLSDIIKAINDQAVTAGVDISVGMNTAGNGLKVTDTSGGVANLIVAGDAAAALGIDGSVAADSIAGSSLQHQYISEATKLSDLNHGRGIGTGKFRITDGLGESAEIDISSDSKTLFDIIQEINSRGLSINARINDTGDGLLIEESLAPGETAFTAIKVESISGSTAKDLNILGTSSTVVGGKIDGSYERVVDLNVTDNLAQVVSKINAAGIPLSASIINSGLGATPFRMSLTSGISGRLGELVIDSGDIDLGFTTLTKGQDAKVFFGADNAEDGFLVTSSSNTITSVIDGVTIDLLDADDSEAVTLTVERDTTKILDSVKQLVTTFNDVIGRINQYDFFDVDSEKKGPLLGNSTTARVREAMYRVVNGRAQGVDSQYQYLRQVGIKVGAKGELILDEAKFQAAYEADPEAVENLFASFEASSSPEEEIFPGVFVQKTEQNVTARGFGDLFGKLVDDLTDAVNGAVKLADNAFGDQIELANKRITAIDARLEARRIQLENQFTAMEVALSKIQGQGNALSQIANNVALAQRR